VDLLKKDGIVKPGSEPDIEVVQKLVNITHRAQPHLVEMKTGALPFILDEITMDEKARAKQLTPDVAAPFQESDGWSRSSLYARKRWKVSTPSWRRPQARQARPAGARDASRQCQSGIFQRVLG
jgi:hypothetical protein